MKIEKNHIFKVKGQPVFCHFQLKPGLNVLQGDNGIGKTTFFHYLKKHRTHFFGNEVCAFMDQFPLNPISELTGLEILEILHKDVKNFDIQKAKEVIKTFNIEDLMKSPVENYSGGENQIFKLILLLGQKASFYFLDEPLQYLDSTNVKILLGLLEQLAHEGKNILLIEHRQEKISHIKYNRLKMEQTTKKQIEIFND